MAAGWSGLDLAGAAPAFCAARADFPPSACARDARVAAAMAWRNARRSDLDTGSLAAYDPANTTPMGNRSSMMQLDVRSVSAIPKRNKARECSIMQGELKARAATRKFSCMCAGPQHRTSSSPGSNAASVRVGKDLEMRVIDSNSFAASMFATSL